MSIAKITAAYTRFYADTNSTVSYVEWVDTRGRSGRTEGKISSPHMQALFERARREGIIIGSEK